MARDDSLNNSLQAAMLDLTGDFVRHMDIDQTLSHVTAAAVNFVDGIDYADVMLIDEARMRSIAPTASLVTDLDRVQMRLNQGPCLEAAVGDSIVRSADLSQERRWPEFAAAALEMGIRSVMSFQLYTHRSGAGALNLLGRQPGVLDVKSEAFLAMLATHAAIALIAADKESQFDSALASRDVIGQAKGIVMERFKIDAQRAFELLAKLSQDSNTPLRQIAQRMVDSLQD
jgi:transcriptional regulator with GAF, ATPase, and Fis domain